MKILLLLNQSYPNGYALTKRFHLYAKGFVKKGHQALIILPHPTEKNEDTLNQNTSGIYDEVPFRYMSSSTIRSTSFFKRRQQDITGSIKTGIFLLKEKPDIVISSNFSYVFFIYLRIIHFLLLLRFFGKEMRLIT